MRLAIVIVLFASGCMVFDESMRHHDKTDTPPGQTPPTSSSEGCTKAPDGQPGQGSSGGQGGAGGVGGSIDVCCDGGSC